MSYEPGRLRWYIDPEGYSVGDPPADDPASKAAGTHVVGRRGQDVKGYWPEDTPYLYRRFVELPGGDESAVRDFVAQYGFLGINVPDEWDGHRQERIPHPEWIQWEAIEAITRRKDELRWIVRQLERVLEDESHVPKDERANGPRTALASYFTQEAPALFSIRLTPVPRAGGPLGLALEPQPLTLLSLMWSQVADAIRTGVVYRSCEICGAPFQVGPGHSRIDKVTCSPRCQKARQRQRRARED